MNNYQEDLINELYNIYGEDNENIQIPPPVFIKMNGEILYYSKSKQEMKISFPVLVEYLNPFGNMQGGMLAAAIDNTFGPLSMLVGIKNFTRKFEVKFKKPIRIECGSFVVEAKVQDIIKKEIILIANARNNIGEVLAVSKSIHRVIND